LKPEDVLKRCTKSDYFILKKQPFPKSSLILKGKVLYLNIVRIVNQHRGFSVLTAVLLLAVFFFMMFGQQYLFLSKRYAIRKEIKRKIKNGVDEKDMFFFQLSEVENDPSFYWENDHEFHYKGSMYDVVKRNGDELKCINDDQEAKLFAGLDNLVRKRMDGNAANLKSLQILLFAQRSGEIDFSPCVFFVAFNSVPSCNRESSGFASVQESPPDFS
jgi:hypothetical protein